MADNFSYDVFLSHNAKDKPRVRRLAERLKQAGLRVWFDEWNVRSGDIISLKVDEGLEQSRVLLLCISPNALASNWVALERSTAVHRDPSNEDRRFIPLLLADCDLPDTLRRYKSVDFREEGEPAFEEILTACRPEGPKALPAAKHQTKKEVTKKKLGKAKPPEVTEPLAVLERKLTGHRGWVHSVAVSPNGKWAASGSNDHTVKTWDLETGVCRATLEGHTDEVNCVAITPDGKQILSGSNDHTIRIWDSRSSQHLKTLKHTGSILSLSLSAKAERILSGGGMGDTALRLWEMETGECLREMSVDPSVVWSVAISEDAKRAVSGSGDNAVRVWNLETGECLATLKGHSHIVKSVWITPNKRFAASGSEDTTVKIWDLETGTCVGTLEGHQSPVHSVAIPPDGALIASTGFTDHTVRLWDWKSWACLQVIRQKGASPMSVAFSPDGSRLVVGTADAATIYVYRLTSVRHVLAAEATRRYVNAKVVLLGEGTVGKTSLAHRLIEDKYVVKDRTHGMNVWPLQLPLAPDATMEREALLWDLAGQEDYRLIHQLFLDETALALLLVNPQKDDPFAEAGDWLKALKTAGGQPESSRDANRLLIFSQTDVSGMKLGNAKIERFREQYGFTDWLDTSAKTGANCSDQENGGQPSKLKELIARSIPWNKLPWTSTPRLLAELKDAMMAMRDKTDIRLVRFAELAQRMEQALPGEKFGESEVRTAVTLLANNGLARPLKFGDLVLLQPELLNGYAGAIIRAARAHTDEIGCVLEANIYKSDFDFTGVERLKHRPDEELLLRALVQTFLDHSLCIAEDMEQGRQLVFPSQYRREKDIPRDPDIFVSYSFSGEWQTVWTTLVVRLWYSQEFEHRELWRNAAEFASGKGHTLGLKIDNRQGEGAATISLYFDVQVPDELKAIFIEYTHRHLAKFGCEVSRDRRYVCPKCGKPVKDLDAVRKRLDAKKDFIYCQGCDKKVPLIDFIEQRLKSDPVARKILAMDETATRELDTQALEQILIGHMMAIAGEANQIFRPVMMFDNGIDGEVEFKDDNGKASGKIIYVQLRNWNYYERTRREDGSEVFDVTNERHLKFWVSQPVDVYLVIRQTDETGGGQIIRWMNVTRYLKKRKDKTSRQIIFAGEKLDMEAVWKVRDQFFPPRAQTRK
jgi:WD40 repeat protein/GTPase SAR1 family protein/DNA-directed RNA polymerase subunit RPC12/RpoP